MVAPEIRAAARALCRLVPTAGPLPTPCWLWPGASSSGTPGGGYGYVKAGGRVMTVHGLVYRALVGEPPAGHELHHRCEVRLCANPEHLQPLTVAQHRRLSGIIAAALRRTHCPRNHPLVPGNLRAGAHRACLRCHRDREAARRHAGVAVYPSTP